LSVGTPGSRPDNRPSTEWGQAFIIEPYEFCVGAFASATTPGTLFDALHKEIARALDPTAVQERLKTMGGEILHKPPHEFAEQFRGEIRMNAELVKDAGLNSRLPADIGSLPTPPAFMPSCGAGLGFA